MQKNKQKNNKKKKNWKKDWKTKQSRAVIALLAGFFVLCGGCARKNEVQMSGILSEAVYEAGDTEKSGEKTDAQAGDNSALAEAVDRSGMQENAEMTEGMAAESEKLIYVHVCGAVQHPGVYPMAEGTRVYEAVALAGGFLSEADEQWLNQAAVIGDAQKLYVYSKEETRQMETEPGRESRSGGGDPAQSTAVVDDRDTPSSGGIVNLNTASKEDLMMLPGIGEAKAEAILQYRSEHGAFSASEELLQISGIKEGVFSRIKDRITVR